LANSSQPTNQELVDTIQLLQGLFDQLESKHRQTISRLQQDKEQERDEHNQQIHHLKEEHREEARRLREEQSCLQTRCESAEEALHEKGQQLSEYRRVLDIKSHELHVTNKLLGSGSYGGKFIHCVQLGHLNAYK
jgi:FtsZ-binding cell division protein ZapB